MDFHYLNDLAERIHANARAKGFWDHETIVAIDPVLGDVEARLANPSILPEKLALVHSEVSEALEALRDGDQAEFDDELADIVIRVLDIAAREGIDIQVAIENKIAKNALRPRMHGRKGF